METTLFLSKLLGIVFLTIGVSPILHPRNVEKVASNITQMPILRFLLGMVRLLVGLTILLLHDKWATTAEIIISTFGWVLFLIGMMTMTMPDTFVKTMTGWFVKNGKSIIPFAKVLIALLGAYLAYQGFVV